MTTLLIAEHDHGSLKDVTAKALTAARALGAPVHVLVAGANVQGVAEAAARLDGVDKVLLAEDARYDHGLAEPTAALIAALAGPYDAVVAAATTTGKNVLPRVAALLDVMQVSDITKVLGPDTFERPIYAGNAHPDRAGHGCEEGDHGAHGGVPADGRGRRGGSGRGRAGERGGRRRARRSGARRSRRATGRS